MTNDNVATFADQANLLVAENQHLRVKSENDDITIRLLKEQYDSLAATVNGVRDKAAKEIATMQDQSDRKISDLTIQRDQAVRKHATVQTLLMQASEIVMQAIRAEKGDETPEQIPDVRGTHINDVRLPGASLNG